VSTTAANVIVFSPMGRKQRFGSEIFQRDHFRQNRVDKLLRNQLIAAAPAIYLAALRDPTITTLSYCRSKLCRCEYNSSECDCFLTDGPQAGI
jgi:hypothetical protein